MAEISCLQKLPELSEKIFIFLDTSSVLECRLVCRAFNHIIENPHFWLKKLSIDGSTRMFHKMTETMIYVIKELSCHDYAKKLKYFYRYVWSNDNENQFYGAWHYRLYTTNGMGSKYEKKDITTNLMIALTVSYLEENFNTFLTKWRQVIINQKEMNLAFDKSHLLYLIKINKLFSTLKNIPAVSEAIVKQFSLAMRKRKRGNWTQQAYFKNKMDLPVTIFQLWTSYFALTLKYWPTLACNHCPNALCGGSSTTKFETMDQCSECYKIYNIADPPAGEKDAWKFEELNHILELCFHHRKILVDDCSNDVMVKFLAASGGVSYSLFVDPAKHGFL